jgi:acetolactate synthase I/II/III large subunit
MANARTGGEILMDCLVALGARRGFGVPGESYLALLDAMHDATGFRFVNARHEGGAAFMAEAHGKLTGEPGLCFVTRGPGATNAAIGVHTARQNSSPMILFVGQVGTDMKGREAFQEIDYTAFFGPVAKWTVEIDNAARIPEIVARAWTTALSGRPGPVVVSLPEDMLTDRVAAPPMGNPRVPSPAPEPAAMTELQALLDRAERPVALVGGGGWSAEARARLARAIPRLGLPVLAAFRFHDLYDNEDANYAGEAGVGMLAAVRQTLTEADLILAIGVRFGEMTTDGYTVPEVPKPAQVLVHVHASDAELGKVYVADLPIHAGPAPFLAALEGLRGDPARWGAWRDARRAAWLKSFDLPPQPGPVDMGAVMAHLRETLPHDAILTNGAGNFAIWPNKLFRFTGTQRLLAPQSGAMGYGVPAAIAAKAEHPDRTVICFAGDGDFQMTGLELATAVQAGCAPVVLVLDNGTYGTIRMHQERHYPARVSGTDLVNPDFAALARAMGLHGERVDRTADFAPALARALASPTGALLALDIGTEALTPRETLSQMRAKALAAKG